MAEPKPPAQTVTFPWRIRTRWSRSSSWLAVKGAAVAPVESAMGIPAQRTHGHRRELAATPVNAMLLAYDVLSSRGRGGSMKMIMRTTMLLMTCGLMLAATAARAGAADADRTAIEAVVKSAYVDGVHAKGDAA